MDSQPFLLPQGVQHQQNQDVDAIIWSNKDIVTNKFLVLAFTLALLLIIAIMAYFTYQIYVARLSGEIFLSKFGTAVVYLFCGLMSLGLFFQLYSLTRIEVIQITDENVFVRELGLFAPKPTRLPKHQVTALFFHRHDSGEPESQHSLNLMYNHNDRKRSSHWDKRLQLAFWMRTEDKQKLYFVLENIMRRRGWDIEYRATL